jgi:hypothetical protein
VPSIKLSVTVRSSLERKYDSASLKLLDRAVTDWIAHEEKPGQTEMTRMDQGETRTDGNDPNEQAPALLKFNCVSL